MAEKRRMRHPDDLLTAAGRAHADAVDPEIRALLHELQVHSEEIAVQNEELLKAQTELEFARDRYADLYDFAPTGYISLDSRDAIVEINLQGASLLGRQRAYLVGLPFVTLAVREHRDRLRDFLARAHDAHDGPAPKVEVKVKDGTERWLRLLARPQGTPGQHHLFVAMLDVTEERRLEAERHAAYAREQARTKELAEENAVRLAAEERVKALLERLVAVQEQERRRIALNLHDQLGQQLTALRLTLGALKQENLGKVERQKRFEMIESIVAQLDRDVDFLAWELRPAALDEVGLDAALVDFVRQWSWTRGVAAELHGAQSGAPRLPGHIETHLYRICQEALNNVAKHAQAQNVSVLIERRGDEVRLIVEDDGQGFDVNPAKSRWGGIGLAGMQERAASIGGSVEVESAPGKGTTLYVRVPVSAVSGAS